ncbi:EamA family transporter [Nocardia sp. CY41]|uniref:EamA family transporter n=1 Tax=Nocardia sp. CY41 TaxID=2608686 RepID=UPI001F258A1A|nr:EamA family transporter [Nocardia sp. CY41]
MSSSVSSAARSGVVHLVGAGLLWGTGGLLGTLVHRATGLPPVSVATCRLAVGGLLLVVLLAGTRRPWPRDPLAWRRIGAVAVLAAIFQAAYFGAVAASTVGLATLITIGMSPVVVAGLEHVTGRHAVDRRRAVTIGIALGGLALLVAPSGRAGAGALLLGAALAAVAAVAFATVTVLNAAPVPGLDAMTTTGLGFTGGAVLLVPLAALGGLTFDPTPAGLALVLLLGLAPTAVAYTLYFRGLSEARWHRRGAGSARTAHGCGAGGGGPGRTPHHAGAGRGRVADRGVAAGRNGGGYGGPGSGRGVGAASSPRLSFGA